LWYGIVFLFGVVNQAMNKIMKKYIMALDGRQVITTHNNQPITRGRNRGEGIGLEVRPSTGAREA
jgi:hypothetical protein